MHSLERLLVEIRQKPSLTFHVFYENCRPPKPEHVIQCLLILERSHLKASFETYVCNIIDIWIKVLPKEKLQMLKRVHKINKVKFKVNVQFLHFFGYLRRTINQQCAVLPRVLFNLHVLWQVSFGCWVTWSISTRSSKNKNAIYMLLSMQSEL